MRNVTITALAGVGALALVTACSDPSTAPTGLAAGRPSLSVTGPVAFPDNTCPNTGTGTPAWTKIDQNTGSATGSWGSFSYGGSILTATVNPGYVLEVCIKNATNVNVWTVTGENPPVADVIDVGQNAISHTAWRVLTEPTNLLQGLSVSKGAAASYDRTVTWQLSKTVDGGPSVSFEGLLGESFPPVDWEVIADKSESVGNYHVEGQITVTNPNPVPVDVSVADVLYAGAVPLGIAVAVDCDPVTGGAQATGTVPAEGSLVCDYAVSPGDASATLNRADVTVTGYTPPEGYTGTITGGFATAAVSWVENVVGDDEVTLADERFAFSQLISADRTENFPETFACPADRSLYTDGWYENSFVNTATLTGDNTDLSASATVSLRCRDPWVGESATGDGLPWSATRRAPNTWFMYTPYAAGPVDLIAGQHHDAGDITMTRNGTTSITITLHEGFRFAETTSNVKIEPMSCGTNQNYVQPGQFDVKRTVLVSENSITVTGLTNADCYGIHVDVERYAP